MHARLHLEMVHPVADSFSGGDWRKTETRMFVHDRQAPIEEGVYQLAKVIILQTL